MIPKFSIITVCFNAETTIKNTINSVLAQTIQNFEYIIIDGKSTDKTVKVIKSFKEQFRAKNISYTWISEPDQGIYDAFNKGVELATGEWISFLGADDIYVNNALELYSKYFPEKEVDFIYSNVEIANNKVINDIWSWAKFRRRMHIAHVGGFHNRKYFMKYGLFDTSYKIAGDYELLLRAKEHLKSHKVNATTVFMGNDGISNTQIKKVYLETTRAKKETAQVSSVICQLDFLIWMFKFVVKKGIHALAR